jgi:hypothetical protein
VWGHFIDQTCSPRQPESGGHRHGRRGAPVKPDQRFLNEFYNFFHMVTGEPIEKLGRTAGTVRAKNR